MAAGLTIKENKIEAFARYLDDMLASDVKDARANELKIDAALSATGATEELVTLLEKAGPFGAGNPEPLFVFPSTRSPFPMWSGRRPCALYHHQQFRWQAQGHLFRVAEEPLGKLLLNHNGRPLHIAGSLSLDHWQGRPSVQLRIIDAAEVTN